MGSGGTKSAGDPSQKVNAAAPICCKFRRRLSHCTCKVDLELWLLMLRSGASEGGPSRNSITLALAPLESSGIISLFKAG